MFTEQFLTNKLVKLLLVMDQQHHILSTNNAVMTKWQWYGLSLKNYVMFLNPKKKYLIKKEKQKFSILETSHLTKIIANFNIF